MSRFTVGQNVVTTVECFDIPAGAQGVVVEVHWELEKLDVYGVSGSYGIKFNIEAISHLVEMGGDVWNYYDTELGIDVDA